MNKRSKKEEQRHRPCKQLRLQYHDEAIRLYYEEQMGGIGRTDAEAETPVLWPPDAKS